MHLLWEGSRECGIICILTFSLGNPLFRGKTTIFSQALEPKGLITLTFPRKLNWIVHCLQGPKTYSLGKENAFFHDSIVGFGISLYRKE